MTIQEALEQRRQNMQKAEEIRQTAKQAGTWGVQQNSTLAYTPPKVEVPEEQKTSADKMWDRNSQPQKIETTTRAKQKRDTTKKEYDDYVNSEEYRQKRIADIIAQQIAKDRDESQSFASTSEMAPPIPQQDEKEMRLRAARDQAEKEYNEAENKKRFEADMEVINGLSEEDRKRLEIYSASKYSDRELPEEYLVDSLLEDFGRERLDELERTYSRYKNAKRAEEVDAKAREFVSKRGGRGTLANILSVPVQAYSGIIGTFGQLAETMIGTGGYKTQDPNAYGTIGQTLTGAIRGQTSENITEDLGDGFVGKAANIGYQGVMAAADSVAQAYLGGGGLGGATLAATNSFSQTMADASRKGATPAQAAVLATTTAGIEALTEKIPLDNLIRTAKGTNAKSVIANALRQAGIEATTEEISLLGSVLAEAAILQEKSSYQRDIMTAIMSGIPVDDAIQQASQNIIDEAVNTALVSMISGGASSLGGSYADARGMFAETQEQTNPELNRPKNAQEATQEAIANNQERRERLAAEEATQQPQTAQTQEPERTTTQPQQQETRIQQPAQPKQSVSDTVAEVLTNLRETNGKATNKMAETVMSDPAAMQELGITPEGTKAEQRRRVKEEMEKLFQNQNETTEVSTPAVDTQNQSLQEGQTTNRPQNVDSVDNLPAETSTNVDNKAAQPVESSTNVDKMSRNVDTEAETTVQRGATEMQRDRINSVREQAIPKTDSDGKVVSETAGNVYTSSRTPDSFAENIRRIVNEGRVSHDVQTNEESLNKAAASIAEDGSIQNALNSIKEVAKSGRTGAIDVAKGVLIYDELVKSSDSTHQALAEECFVTLTELATNTGRPMQLFSLFRKMTPESQLRTMERVIQRNVERLQKSGTVKKDFRPTFNQELEQNYIEAARDAMNAKTDQARQEAEQSMQELQNAMSIDAAAQMPSTFKAKWDAWRYMAMLGNVKTQVRNVAGNALFAPYKVVKDRAAALGEKLFLVPKDKRTKSMFTDLELLKWAREDRNTQSIKDALQYSAKLGDNLDGQKFRDNAKVFDTKALEATRKLVESVPKAGDMLFKNGYYARTLADFVRARGYKLSDIQNGKVSAEVLNEARAYAVQEAMKATFNDSNVLSDFLSTEIRYKGENPVGKLYNTVLEGVLPFRKTPANIMVRFEEYSPLGIANTIWKGVDAIRGGKSTAADVIDSLASSLTGSAAMTLGYFMAKGLMGVKLTGSNTGEDEERQGHQDYALEWADKDGQEYSYRIDWAAPANLPLFVGANIYNAIESAGEDTDVSKFTSFVRGMGNAFEPMLALSCLSGVNDLFESARYAEEGEALYTVASKIATGYFTQGIPALLRQASQASNEYKQTTFANSNDPTMRDLQTTAANIPFVGDKFKTEKVNEWGEKESQGTAFERIVNSFLNPGTLKKIDTSAVEQEISRLNNAQDENVSPDYIPKVVSYTDREGNFHKNYRLTEEQYQKFGQTQGQTARSILDTMVNSKNYQALTDEQKAAAINMVYSYAKEKAMGETFGTTYGETWMMKLTKGKEANQIISRTADNAISNAFSKLDTAWDSGYSKENTAAYSRELSEVYDSYSKMNPQQKQAIKASATGNAAKYIEAREKGISHDKFVNVAMNVNNIKGTGAVNKDTGKATVRDIDKRQAIAKTTGLSDREVDIIMKAYMPDYDKNDESPETTEFKYQYAREELGLSPKEYAATYRAYLDNGKKAQKIAAIRAMGYDYKTANALYKLYYGRMKDDLIEMYG